ncbi:hypothetical protein RB653_000725 [Dictyostelium firmibasis]|uniref:VWFA domain-containing protein n=1 Tax=Dictyostelium firmibasis TaxID=79012 RepID=A0AAN7YW58_9MYCE
MTILSWLFKSTQNKNNNKINNTTSIETINITPDNEKEESKEEEQEQKEEEEEEEEGEEEEKEEEEEFNYFDTSYFNQNNFSYNNNLINHLKSNFNDNQANEIVISFDTTGKMFSYFVEFRNQLDKILSILFKRLPTLKIAIMAHGDYCDDTRQTSYFNRSISILPFTNNLEEIKSFVNSIEKTNGDDAPECYEYSMRKARELPWSVYSKKSFIIIGDDVPHPPSYTDQHFYWRNELHFLTKIGIKVYGVQCHNNSHAKLFYEELATLSNGRYIHLKDSKDIGDLIVLIAFRENVNKNFLKSNLYEITGKDDLVVIGNNDHNELILSPSKQKKKQIKEKFYQLFSNVFTRERNSSINIRFPWWDISFDVTPNPRYMWDSDSKLFVENIISIQNECPIGIPTSLVSPITIEKSSSSTTVTPSSSYGNLFKMSSSPNKSINNSSDNLDFSLDSFADQQPIEVVIPINSSSLISSCTTLHQENNFIKTITKPRHPFTSFCQNSSLINTPFNYNNNNNNNNNNNIHSNTSFSKAGMSITIDKPKPIFKNSNGKPQPHLQPQRILTPSRKRKSPEEEGNSQEQNKQTPQISQLQQQLQTPQTAQQTPQTSQQSIINGSTIGSTKNMNLISEFIKEQLNLDSLNTGTKTTTSKSNNKIITTTPVNTTSSTTSLTPNSTTSTTSSTITTTTLIHKTDEPHPKKFQRNLYSASVHSHYNSSPSSISSNICSGNNDENYQNIGSSGISDNNDDESQTTTVSDCNSGINENGDSSRVDTQAIDQKKQDDSLNPFFVFDPSTKCPIIPKSITQTTTTTTTTTTTALLT